MHSIHHINPSMSRTQHRAGARFTWAALALGLLALTLILLAGPAHALGSELEAVNGCMAESAALTRFHPATAITDPAHGAWSLGQARFYVAQYGAESAAWCEALSRFHAAKSIADPAEGALSLSEANFLVSKYAAESAACASWDDAMARFQRAKPVADPANGALSPSEAEFFVAKYGAYDSSMASVQHGAAALCSVDLGTAVQ